MTTICLCMIVRDEAPVILRCLASVKAFVDAWVIVDTGSTDGTQDLVRAAMADLPGELFERPWKNFGHNRSEALDLARGRADYTLVIDADEQLWAPVGWRWPKLSADSYSVTTQYGGIEYHRRQVMRSSLPWRYVGVLHEYATCDEAKTEGTIAGLVTVVTPDGARSRDPEKFRKDAALLEEALVSEPENSRYRFYLAQSYRDAGDDRAAAHHYGLRAAMGGWQDEIWCSLYQRARARDRLGEDCVRDYLEAWNFDSTRAESLYWLGMHYQRHNKFAASALFFDAARTVPYPGSGRLFVEPAIYQYLASLEYAVALYYIDKRDEAIRVNKALLMSSAIPAEHKALVRANLEACRAATPR